MAANDHYFPEHLTDQSGLGDMRFLKAPQEAASPGGGQKLLGSVLPEAQDGWWILASTYPLPSLWSVPQGVLKYMRDNRGLLHIPEGDHITQSQGFAPGDISLKVSKTVGGSLELGLAPLVGVPVGLSLQVDYSTLNQIDLSYGASTRKLYIEEGWLRDLWAWSSTDLVDRSGGLERGYMCVAILLTKDYTVTFQSSQSFSADFSAKLSQFANLPTGSASVKYEPVDDQTFKATIKSDKAYVVAIEAKRWSDLSG